MTKHQAYDVARKEFYALRHEEEVERRVAKEEAMWTGAYFGKSVLEIGMQLEDQVYESWKEWATTEIEAAERIRDAAYSSLSTPDEVDEEVPVIEEALPEEPVPVVA
jgi:small subunit ribosomal protein S23